MAKSINQVIIMGRLTRDPELRTTTSGKNIASFSVAVDRYSTNNTDDDTADFFEVTAWEKLGELVDQYLSKGSKVLLQGRLRQETWDDKETGKKRSKVGIVATDVTFLDNPSSNKDASEKTESTTSKPKDVVPEDIDDSPIDLSEIPF